MAQGRLQLDPFFALVRLTAQGRLQLDPFFATVRLTAQGRLQLDPFFALRIARPLFVRGCWFLKLLVVSLALRFGFIATSFNYFAHCCFVFPLSLVSLYFLDCFPSPPLFLMSSLVGGGFYLYRVL